MRQAGSKEEKLIREKTICLGVLEGVFGQMQGNLWSPFLKGDQIGSSRKGDLRDLALIENNS